MNILHAIANAIVTGARYFAGFAPAIQAADPKAGGVVRTVSADLSDLANLIVTAQTMRQANPTAPISGPDIAKLIAPAAFNLLIQSSVFKGLTVQDQPKADAAVVGLVGNLADFIQAFHPNGAQTVTTAVPVTK